MQDEACPALHMLGAQEGWEPDPAPRLNTVAAKGELVSFLGARVLVARRWAVR